MAEDKDCELKAIENPEWLKVDVDAEQHILYGIKHSGSVDWTTGKLSHEEVEQLKTKIENIKK